MSYNYLSYGKEKIKMDNSYVLNLKSTVMTDIEINNKTNNPKIFSSIEEGYKIKFLKKKKDFEDYEAYDKFIRSCIKTIRNDPRYKNYIFHLKDNGLNHCMFFGKINDEMAPIEMHHGPLFTIYDIVSIISTKLLEEGVKINTFIISDKVLEEHENNNIQVTMLCKTVHQKFHDGDIFISLKQSFGKVNKFIENYGKGLLPEHMYNMEKYIELSQMHNSTDNGLLRTFKELNLLSENNYKNY